MEGVRAVGAEIDRQLAGARPPGPPPGRLTATRLRAWAAGYLRDRDDARGREPGAGRAAHWNLWMPDAPAGDAPFAVLVFRPDGVEFFCGSGKPVAVRAFCEHPEAPDARAVYATMRRGFPIPDEPLRLDRRAAEAWLGRPRAW